MTTTIMSVLLPVLIRSLVTVLGMHCILLEEVVLLKRRTSLRKWTNFLTVLTYGTIIKANVIENHSSSLIEVIRTSGWR